MRRRPSARHGAVPLKMALLWFGAVTIAASAPAGLASRPLHLVTDTAGTGTRLRVIGDSKTVCDSPYVLEVTSTSPTGRNRSVQRGTARLRPDVVTTVATSILASPGMTAWSARVDVDPCGTGKHYQETSGTPRQDLP
jgi:hypothetical protein